MPAVLWLVLALVAAFGVVAVSARRARRTLPALELPPGESLPPTPLQRLALQSLIAASGLAAVGAGLVVYLGPQRLSDDTAIRLIVTGLALAALAVAALVPIRAGRWAAADAGRMDERDRAILAGASSSQSGAILITLAVWMIGLAEAFRSAGAVPTVYLFLVFWSCVLINMFALLGGIVLAYRRS